MSLNQSTFIEDNYPSISLMKVVDVLGREVTPDNVIETQPLFYIYDDGTVEKKIILE